MGFDNYEYERSTETIIYEVGHNIYERESWIDNHKEELFFLKNIVENLNSDIHAEIYIEFNQPIVHLIFDIDSDYSDILRDASDKITGKINEFFIYPKIVYHSSNCIFLNFSNEEIEEDEEWI